MYKSDTIRIICDALQSGDKAKAREVANHEYPFFPTITHKRSYTNFLSTQIFIRDGFIDRYSGQRLIYPPTLRLLSHLLPEEFPAHPNWKMSESHIIYWELFPTIDHIVPIARGGIDDESNWVCTSMLRNSAKSNWTLEELGWTLISPGKFGEWDGLLHWFLHFVDKNPEHLQDHYLKRWHSAALRALKAV